MSSVTYPSYPSPAISPAPAIRPQPGRRGLLIGANLRAALKALRANGLRSFLTMLGVIFGVAAVIACVTLTEGVSTNINQQFASLGTNMLVITNGVASNRGALEGVGSAPSLTVSDVQALATVPHLVNVSPLLVVHVQAIYGGQNWSTQVVGVYPGYQSLQNWQMAGGSWFSSGDQSAGLPVAVLGQTVVQNLFASSGTDPIGQTIRINNQLYRVVGTLQPKGQSGGSSVDDVIYVPFTTALNRLYNTTFVSSIQAQVDNVNNVSQAQQDVTTLLEKQHHIQAGAANDFRVFNSNQLIQTAQQSIAVLAALLIGIAAISLTVGGIGIMNIMLVSVSERTREIGIRMAVGARQSDIRNQFLIEALTLSTVGGIIGIVFGLFAGLALVVAFQQPFAPNIIAILLAFSISATVGVIFGLYPAVRASRLDPIVALRTE
ncbi:MAG TPA: ABC transporter permease [Ktedonobacteraceae bacterium]